MGYIERGGWATYSDTSWEFRATYVSIELRLAAYFWFKFRAGPTQSSSPERSRKRARAEKGTPSVSSRNKRNKFEPRLKAYKRTGDKKMEVVWLGDYDTFEEAADVFWIGAFYYNRRDRFTDELFSWCEVNLPPLSSNLTAERKQSWVQEKAKEHLTRSRHQAQGPVVVVQNQAAAYVDSHLETYGTWEEDNLPPMDFILESPQTFTRYYDQAESTRIGSGQHGSQDITADDDLVETYSTLGEVSGQGAGSEGVNPLRTCADESVHNEQDAQHFQKNHRSTSVLEGGEAVTEVRASLQQDESDVLRMSANHPQAVDLQIGAQELIKFKFTNTILFGLGKLHDQCWDYEIQPYVSTEFSIAYPSLCEDQGPKFTHDIVLALKEIHEQGFKTTLKPLSIASSQDGNRRTVTPVNLEAGSWRAQSGSGSRDQCWNCSAPQSSA